MTKKSDKVLNLLKMEFLSLQENVGLARVAVASFAAQDDLTLNELEEIKVAVSEAVSNSIIHGYDNSEKGIIKVTIIRYEDRMEIEVTDEGKGIEDVDQAVQPAFSTDPERMGLGFVFMGSFMDTLIVNSKPGSGTQVIMGKRIVNNLKN
ncbi:anti-sigma F factor [Desulfitibacter alkalitolerans]|uniref:anti-sigma F factor n=1 Tax=Desulfitibacter alkalitolerans TaxID=264641 RepID=UPI00055630CD|nr:anti-sigma F factor [Desulfitibacter alkalitolerans]